MRIPFRQGIVSAPAGFLQLNGSTVDLSIAALSMLMVSVADGDANYLITERFPITSAWGGPFVAGAQSYWLYWDLNPITGQRTFGHTLLEPKESVSAPLTPADDQHWFDIGNVKMKVWNAVAGRWIPKIRVFAAKLDGGSVFVSPSINAPSYIGTQAGLLGSIPTTAGALMYDVNGDPVKRKNGAFFTTEDVVVAGVASAAQVKVGAVMIPAVAVGNIPAYSIVHFKDFNQVDLATNVVTTNGAYGMIETDAATGDLVTVAMEGLITNPAWNWMAQGVNTPLYVSTAGALTTSPPPNPVVVATIVDVNTILLRSAITTVGVSGGSGTPLSVKDEGSLVQSNVDTINFIGANVTAAAGAAGVANVTVSSSGSSAPRQQVIIAASGQTVFNTTIPTIARSGDVSHMQVFRNGVYQLEDAASASPSFSVTGANQITFALPMVLDDEITILYFA